MGLLHLAASVRELSVFGLPLLEFIGFILTLILIVYHVPDYITTVWKIWIAPYIGRGGFADVGEWAIITGASDGIGRAFAEQLAERGLNIVLISRTRSKLDAVAELIENKFPVKTKVVVADFTNGVSVYEGIKEELQDLEIGILINNVGTGPEFPNPFLEMENGSEKFLQDILFCNVFPVTMMTRLVLPEMVSRRKGIIINVSSILGVCPIPHVSVYSATKAYIDNFTQSLAVEYEGKGIIIQSLLPGFVHTKLIKAKRPSAFAPTPDTFVRSALKTVGLEDRTSAHWTHRLGKRGAEFLSYFFPRFTIVGNSTLFITARDTVLKQMDDERREGKS